MSLTTKLIPLAAGLGCFVIADILMGTNMVKEVVTRVQSVWNRTKTQNNTQPAFTSELPTPPAALAPASTKSVPTPPVAPAPAPTTSVPTLAARPLPSRPTTEEIIRKTPSFNGYTVRKGSFQAPLSAMYQRPSNLFLDAIKQAGKTVPKVTMPGYSGLFAFVNPQEVRNHIFNTSGTNVIEFSAKDLRGQVYRTRVHGPVKTSYTEMVPLQDAYGSNTYRISYRELQDTLNSQRIYCSPMLPLEFYHKLKASLIQDKHIVLPGKDNNPVLMKDLSSPACRTLIASAQKNPTAYGFTDAASFNKLLNMTIYQVGAMVVKTEDFRIFTDGNGQILERQPGEQDAICLINACGIRGFRPTDAKLNSEIMRHTFATALHAAGSGYTVFPAVGMGVWGGDPNVYWNSFLNAVAFGADNLEQIFINPGHQATPGGSCKGKTGNEFAEFLQTHIERYRDAGNTRAVRNLQKIVNLYEQKTDVLQLARNLKSTYPEKTVSIFNASDPDVTLGNHVTEYMNTVPHHAATTEEHYSMMGTNLLCFEEITGIHSKEGRILQAQTVFV